MRSVLFTAAEGLPFCKSGGLADVIGSLPQALLAQGYDVRVVLPLYLPIAKKFRAEFTELATYDVHFGYFHAPATVFEKVKDGVRYYFIQHAPYFERDAMYGYADDGERFSFYQMAILEMCKALDYFPDIMHEHDWHTGMLPVLCKEKYGWDERYRNILKKCWSLV